MFSAILIFVFCDYGMPKQDLSYSPKTNVKINLIYYRNSTRQSAAYQKKLSHLAIDGDLDTCSFIIRSPESDPWWRIDLDRHHNISMIRFFAGSQSTFILDDLLVYVSGTLCKGLNNDNIKGEEGKVKEVHCFYLMGNSIAVKKRENQISYLFTICEIEIYVDLNSVNLAYNRPVFQSGTTFQETSLYSVDGNYAICSLIHSKKNDYAWWRIHLDNSYFVSHVDIFFKKTGDSRKLFEHVNIFVSDNKNNYEAFLCLTFGGYEEQNLYADGSIKLQCADIAQGRFVTLRKYGVTRKDWLFLCEVEIFMKDPRTVMNVVPTLQKCRVHEFKCYNPLSSKCIHRDWVCDGVEDCPFGEDEDLSCVKKKCGQDSFKCTKRDKCIHMVKRCNGVADCEDNSDEHDCLTINFETNFVMAIFDGKPNHYVCSDNWKTMYGTIICKDNYNRKYYDTEEDSVDDPDYIHIRMKKLNLRGKYRLPGMLAFTKKTKCKSGTFVKLHCGTKFDEISGSTCGKRGLTDSQAQPYIVNGESAVPGAHPWTVQIFVNNLYACGGSILNEYWILTSAFCIKGIYFLQIYIKVGTNILDDPNIEKTFVSYVVTHPDYAMKSTDIGLIKLLTPLKFSDFIKPICLPQRILSVKKLMSFQYCVTSGFGVVGVGQSLAQLMKQGRMNIMTEEECYNNVVDSTGLEMELVKRMYPIKRKLCGGSFPTKHGINICGGDNGSPLVCKSDEGVWTQIGIADTGIFIYQHKMCRNSIFGRIDYYLDFINGAMEKY